MRSGLMSTKIFEFGQVRPEYAVSVLNERAVRAVAQWVYNTAPTRVNELPLSAVSLPAVAVDPAEAERCKVPDFAKAMGHEEKWKLHNNCK